MEKYLTGEIVLMAMKNQRISHKFLPCEGQLLKIEDYLPLFDVIKFTYGGDNRTYFVLPDLRKRVPVGSGNGEETTFATGQTGGEEKVRLEEKHVPNHAHVFRVKSSEPNVNILYGNDHLIASEADIFNDNDFANLYLSEHAISRSPRAQLHENRQPFLVLRYWICVDGIHPTPS